MPNKLTRLMKSKKFHDFFIVPLTIIVSAVLNAVSVQIFTVPFEFAPGGVTGIASIIQTETGFNAGYSLAIINLPLLVIAWFFIGKKFTVLTALTILLSSVLMIIMPYINLPHYTEEGAEPIFAALAAGIIGGAGIAIMFRVGGSHGGTDVIAVLIQRHFRATNVAWFIAALDFTVVIASFFVYDMRMTPIFMSITQLVSFSMMSDIISSGFKSALKYEVITKNADEISAEIIEKLGRGVTCVPATGMYLKEEETLLICVIRKRQLSKFNEIIKKYPSTFAYVTNTSEVVGLGFEE